MKRTAALLLLLASAACGSDPSGPDVQLATGECGAPAPLTGSAHPALPNAYIVVFKDGTDARAASNAIAARYGFQTRFIYEHALPGFAAVMDPVALASVRCESSVKYVEHDMLITIDD